MLGEGIDKTYASLVSNLMQHLDSHWPLLLHLKPATKNIFLMYIVSAGIEDFFPKVFKKDSMQEELAKSCKL